MSTSPTSLAWWGTRCRCGCTDTDTDAEQTLTYNRTFTVPDTVTA